MIPFLQMQKNKLFFKRLKFFDYLIIFFSIFFSFYFITQSTKKISTANKVIVTANQTKYEFSLLKDGIYSVEGLLGTTTIKIESGKVQIIDSVCPNKTCVKQGQSKSIICLPNKVYVEVCSKDEFDAVVQ